MVDNTKWWMICLKTIKCDMSRSMQRSRKVSHIGTTSQDLCHNSLYLRTLSISHDPRLNIINIQINKHNNTWSTKTLNCLSVTALIKMRTYRQVPRSQITQQDSTPTRTQLSVITTRHPSMTSHIQWRPPKEIICSNSMAITISSNSSKRWWWWPGRIRTRIVVTVIDWTLLINNLSSHLLKNGLKLSTQCTKSLWSLKTMTSGKMLCLHYPCVILSSLKCHKIWSLKALRSKSSRSCQRVKSVESNTWVLKVCTNCKISSNWKKERQS